ncbi:MAG: L-rhamnose mutarotase [Gemmataceae bacterium]
MMRIGRVVRIDVAKADEYRRYHDEIWPEILAALREAGIRNYSIFLKDDMLFSYYEYIGPPEELDARLKQAAAAPRMREWWDLMEPMQIPLPTRKPGEWWATMEPVFFFAG